MPNNWFKITCKRTRYDTAIICNDIIRCECDKTLIKSSKTNNTFTLVSKRLLLAPITYLLRKFNYCIF